ncbi:MAG: hypothetical protein JXB35_13820 [Anaerolineae bacterium]|nr:hypothetical protein [Anaerolineae bacterium]
MDFFEVFSVFEAVDDVALKDRSLRLIGLAAIPQDEDAFYFELSRPRHWGRSRSGVDIVGIGGAQLRADMPRTPVAELTRYLRDAWDSKPRFVAREHVFLVEGERFVVLSGEFFASQAVPHMLIITPPRLGGGEMPDALVQAVYFPWLRGRPRPADATVIVRVERTALSTFLERDEWTAAALGEQPWAEIHAARPPAREAVLRPVLALRGIQQVWRAGQLLLEDLA